MRCRACNKQLNDNESVYKNKETGEYLDMCNGCRRASFLTTDLLDVDEDDSLKRKPNDGHSYQEMHEKRENYLKLIQEIKPSMVVDSKACLNDIQKQISETIWKYSVIKQQKDQNSVELPARWIPGNKGKSPAGRNKQKEGFL